MQESRSGRGVDLRALLPYLAAGAVGCLIAFVAPERLLNVLPAEPIWLRPAGAAFGFAGILLCCVIVVRRLSRRSP